MSESFYLYAFGDASDALFQYIGIGNDYRLAGQSFYTVETHINYYLEVSENEPLQFSTQILGLDSKRLHIFHQMFHGEHFLRAPQTTTFNLHNAGILQPIPATATRKHDFPLLHARFANDFPHCTNNTRPSRPWRCRRTI